MRVKRQGRLNKPVVEVHTMKQLNCAFASTGLTPEKPRAVTRAAALGDSFTRVTYPTADLNAEAKEMCTARDDVAEFTLRGDPVTSGNFDRIDA